MRIRGGLLAVVAFAAACVHRGGPPEVRTQLGVYRFIERVPETTPSILLEGTITVERDTIVLDGNPGPCYYETTSVSQSGGIVYRCGETRFYFDREDPLRRVTYAVRTTVRQQVRSCAIYTTDASGRQVCSRWQTEYVERNVTRSGRLRLTRIG
jgi:hypothetical protein